MADFLAGGGEMGARMRALDWSRTPLGAPDGWPQSLRSAVSILLPSKAQIALFWGPELITIYNDAYRPVFGGKHPHALGKPIREAWDELWRAGLKELFESVLATGEAFWAKDRPFYMERHGYREETFFDVSYDPVRDESGRVGGVFCIVSDTTARVVGERRLALLRDLAARNSAARSARDACALAMQTIAAQPHDVTYAAAWLDGELQAATPGVQPALVQELPIGGNGRLVVGLNPERPFDDHYREFLGLVAGQLVSAIANARAYEEERKRAEALAQIDRAKTAFFSNVSHEFRTPLTLMLGPLADGLVDAEHPLPPAQRERQELVLRSALRLQKLVNTLLDFSRIEAGRARASYVATDLSGFTANLASTFRSAVEKAGLELEVDCAPLPEPAWIDREMWEKIVLNLLSNAFKFTFAGRIAVSVRMGEAFVLEVRDTGAGIPAAELPRIFERFHRVEGAKSRTHEGTGIGLALVQELAKLHGGAVRVDSVEGEGSTFTVSIPRGSAHLPAEHVGAASELASTALGPASYVQEALGWIAQPATDPGLAKRDVRIVWADDNADMREYVRSLLAPRYEVEAVADGEAALAAARRRRPALVLADVMMPKLDGLGLARALRADEALRDVPVVLLSARAGEESRIEGLNAGADAYLQKPFSARELLARIETLLESAELRSRIRAERADLGRLFAETPVPIAVLRGPQLVFEMANPAYVEVVDGRAVVGKPILEALPEARGQGFDELLREVMRTGKPYVGREARVKLRRHGAVQDTWFTFIYAPLRDADGTAERVIAIVNDVTEEVRARERMARSEARYREFLAMLSHELRNPLAPIANAVSLLREPGLEPRLAKRAHGILERQLRHLIRLVDDLLDISRISRGEISLQKRPVGLAQVVNDAIETSRPLIEAGAHELQVRNAPASAMVFADPVRLAQVIANLLNNAAKYTPRGGRVEIDVETADGQARISVRDNGVGIEPAELPRLFEMFQQSEATRGRVPGGLGVGLGLARQLAELHGATLEGRSEGAGRGAEFMLRMPLLASTKPQSDADKPKPVVAAARRILVVEDNADAAEGFAAHLRLHGHEVRTAGDGEEALAIAREFRPQVALVDIGLPGMSGYELAHRLRETPALLIALTGHGQKQDRTRAREAGFHHHFVKPADPRDIQAAIGAWRPQ